MIDTVRFQQTLYRNESASVGGGWGSRVSYTPTVIEDGYEEWLNEHQCYTHKRTGVKMRGTPEVIKWIEFSLPRLLYETNGRLIQSQEEIHAAFERLYQVISPLVQPPIHPIVKFTRVDLVWQFRGRPADFIYAHQNCRHPQIRKNSIIYQTESLTWPGKEMRIRLYDKIKEQTRLEGNIVRAEVQLRGEKLRLLLGNGEAITTLDINRCYEVYREILMGLQPFPLPRVSSVTDILLLAQRDSYQPNGVPLFDLWAARRSRRQINRVKREMASRRPEVHRIDWGGLLPRNHLPHIVETSPLNQPCS